MNSEERLKKLRGVVCLADDLDLFAVNSGMREALVSEIQELAQQVEGESPKPTLEENWQLLLEHGWSVRVTSDDGALYVVAVEMLGKMYGGMAWPKRFESVGTTVAGALEFLVAHMKIAPLSWAEKHDKMGKGR